MVNLNLLTKIKNDLSCQGIVQLNQLLPVKTCIELKNQIQNRLQLLITQHGCSKQLYFSAVNRWPLARLIGADWQEKIVARVSSKLNTITDINLASFEVDVLYKSPLANLPTPCHQDISYVWHKPYLLSTWIALTDVSMLESPLQFLPSSHLEPILPAVDFWQPNFIDTFRNTPAWQKKAVTLPIKTGAGLLFSAKLWHGSLDYQGAGERFALVIRWGNSNLELPDIPEPKQAEFGMWNCGAYTQNLLQKGLAVIFNINSTEYLKIITIWMEQLEKAQLPFNIDIEKSILALKRLFVLNQAYEAYSAGDGQGIVYADLWCELLCPLKNYLVER